MIKLKPYQNDALERLKNGSILCGGVGSGKSLTGLMYYIVKVCQGGVDPVKEMLFPRNLYIITTAKKRDSFEWEKECSKCLLNKDPELSLSGVRVTIDSWNNIKKYKKVAGAFFIFDEQRVVGYGAWVKAFLDISRKNQWILLSATPGDQWSDYIPVFIANGFYRNKSDFTSQHCVYATYSKYPKIERYVCERRLEELRSRILVPMSDDRSTIRHTEYLLAEYDRNLYKMVFRDRWDPYENCPIEETSKLMYLIRKVVNSDESRIKILAEIIEEKKYVIVFYNFNYELDMIKEYLDSIKYRYTEWNGHKHQDISKCQKGWVYLVQYSAGCEGWNCITTDTVVFYSQNYSYRVLEQACGRIDRINTPFKDLYYYHIRSNAGIDLAIYQKLKNKQNFNESSFVRRRLR